MATITGSGYIRGTVDADVIYGSDLRDGFDSGSGADSMYGGKGYDTYYVSDINSQVYENSGEGFDDVMSWVSYTLPANVEALSLYGNIDGIGNELDNFISGEQGDHNRMYGKAGNDNYLVDNVNDRIYEKMNDGTDIIMSYVNFKLGANVEDLVLNSTAVIGKGNKLNNNLWGTDYANILYGGGGDDIIDGLKGADKMYGGSGNDLFQVENVGDRVYESLNNGLDTVTSSVDFKLGANVENLILSDAALIGIGNKSSNNIEGTDNANTLSGEAGKDILKGFAGADILDGGKGADTMYGGAENDTYYVDNEKDVINEEGNQGADIVYSTADCMLSSNVENLTLYGKKKVNATGNELNNIIEGNISANIIDGGLGADAMSGGYGNDTYYVDDAGDSVTENYNSGIDTVISKFTTYTLGVNIENLKADDSIISQNFYAIGNILNNKITGGNVNDTIDGGLGADIMIGGKGNDTYYVDERMDLIGEESGQGIDQVFSSATYALKKNVEKLTLTGTEKINATGNSLNNVITGNQAENILSGGAGSDTYVINLNSANDTISDSSGKSDLLSFGDDILKEDIVLFAKGKDLIIVYENGNQVTIKNQLNSASAIEKIQLSDNSYITNTVVNTLIQQMATYAKEQGIQITSADDVRAFQNLSDLVVNSWQGA